MVSHPVDGSNGDVDVAETNEWLESLESVLQSRGVERASYLLGELKYKAIRSGVEIHTALVRSTGRARSLS